MDIIEVALLSVVEGITEFLPISSTGHLILTSKLLNIPATDFLKTFEIVIQLGAILGVFTLYFKDLITKQGLLKKVTVAFIPTAIVGFTLYPFIKHVFLGSPSITLHALFWGGIALILIERLLRKKTISDSNFQVPTYRQAVLIGIIQSISVVPGVSRAAATIVGGLSVGLNRVSATEFSFLLAIPTMFAATGYDLYKSREIITSGGALTLVAGTILSFFFAILAVKFLISYVKKHDFTAFGVYRIILAVLFWMFVK